MRVPAIHVGRPGIGLGRLLRDDVDARDKPGMTVR